jgi:SAM-dependent methyltransferase
MRNFSNEAIRQSGYQREGFAADYHAFRPRPPAVLLDALARYAGESLSLVVDLGSGTGLSTVAWAGRAERVVGVEPNARMREEAERQSKRPNVSFVDAYADETGLDPGCAAIVTCSQSFHWMDREATLAEAARVLRSGGVFAAYDYDVVPLVHPEIDAAFLEHLRLRGRYRDEHRVQAGWTRRPKAEHLDVIRDSGLFAYAREFVLHDEAEADAAELMGLARSLGLVPELVALGVTEEQLGLTRLEETTRRVLGGARTRRLLGYRVRVGVKG